MWAIFDSLVYANCCFMSLQRPYSQLISTQQKLFLTSEGMAQAIITQNVTFRSGFHAKRMHFSPLHRFQYLYMLPFLATAARWMVCDCVTHGKPLSENNKEDDQRF